MRWWRVRQRAMSVTRPSQVPAPTGSAGRGPIRASSQSGWSPASWLAWAATWRLMARAVRLTSPGCEPSAVTVADHASKRAVEAGSDPFEGRLGVGGQVVDGDATVDDLELFPRQMLDRFAAFG